jgi:hypothetical protein
LESARHARIREREEAAASEVVVLSGDDDDDDDPAAGEADDATVPDSQPKRAAKPSEVTRGPTAGTARFAAAQAAMRRIATAPKGAK